MWNPQDPRCVFAVTDSPKPPAERITFSFATIADAANIAVIATGESKNQAIADAFAGNTELPIGAAAALEQCSLWLDDAAARSLPTQQENS
jgi:6-phosphogluconolactonase